ncbi:MAG: hypothetical protein JWN32_4394 [Solirubrobacterales bacterium]|nr:hypothetical protein [Solirubrobacterales bacterium]
MTEGDDPAQHALWSARAAAKQARERGAYDDDLSGFTVQPTDAVTVDRLLEWALIEPDESRVYSTRRWGKPITLLKRGLLRVLHQYHNELLAEQTRFNLQMTVYAGELTEKLQDLEARVAALEERPAPK